MKTVAVVPGVASALAACEAQAEAKVAKKFDADPAIQGNADLAMPIHRKAMQPAVHGKIM